MTQYEAAINRLRDAGHRITDARRAVLEVLLGAGGHLTSAEVLDGVETLNPDVSRASVFRALELLSDMAVIRPTFLEARTPTYVLLTDQGHHAHLICTTCQHVIELEDCHVEPLEQHLAEKHHMDITGHLLEFYGTCEACAGKRGQGAEVRGQ